MKLTPIQHFVPQTSQITNQTTRDNKKIIYLKILHRQQTRDRNGCVP